MTSLLVSATQRAAARVARPGTDRAARWAPTALVVVIVISRLWASRHRRTYMIWPDEPAQLAFARLVSGGARWNMHDHSIWRPGYGLLLGVLTGGVRDPHTVYRVAMILNALLAGAAAIVLYALAGRLTTLGPRGRAVAAGIALLLPASIFITNFAWSEPLTVFALLATILALVHFDARPSLARGVLAVAAATLGFASHTRLVLVLAVVAVVALFAHVRHRLGRAALVGILGAAAAGFVLVTTVSRWAVDALWDEPFERNSVGGLVEQLHRLSQAGIAAIGQAWYLVVSTGGLAVVGVAALIAGAARRPVDERARAQRLVLAVVVPLFALSGLFMADRWRPDHVVYGRYNDAFVGVLVVAGIGAAAGWLGSGRVLRAAAGAAAVAVATAAVILVRRHEQLDLGDIVDPMVLGLAAFGNQPRIEVVRITILAVAVIVVLAMFARVASSPARRAVALAAVVVLLLVAARHGDQMMADGWTRVSGEPEIARLDSRLRGDSVDYYLPPGSTSTKRMMRYQWLLPDTRFEIVNSFGRTAADGPIFAPRGTSELVAAGYRISWRAPSGDVALWQRS